MDRSTLAETVRSVLSAWPSSPGLPPPSLILDQLSICCDIFHSESSLLNLHGSFTIVGDLHGNFTDLLRIFDRSGYPPSTSYLFLGDLIDRGPNSVEVLLLLFALKILYKDQIYFVRGNHECASICGTFGFKTECEVKLGLTVYEKFIDCFSFLPFAATVNSKILCVHGGISADVRSLKEIEELKRPMVSSESPISNGIVWSDPRAGASGFDPSERGLGAAFNGVVLDNFLKENGLSLLVRGHEMCVNGYEWPFGVEGKCLTVFSSSDYCGVGNSSAVVKVEVNGDLGFQIFEALSEKEKRVKVVLSPEWLLNAAFDSAAGLLDFESEADGDQEWLDIAMDLFSGF
jgi:diadenosine tetraphosphatase ApaH/serine/threonine PP2A family protein phosphatase